MQLITIKDISLRSINKITQCTLYRCSSRWFDVRTLCMQTDVADSLQRFQMVILWPDACISCTKGKERHKNQRLRSMKDSRWVCNRIQWRVISQLKILGVESRFKESCTALSVSIIEVLGQCCSIISIRLWSATLFLSDSPTVTSLQWVRRNDRDSAPALRSLSLTRMYACLSPFLEISRILYS